MSHPLITLAVAQTRHHDLMREVHSAEWRMRHEWADDHRLRRPSRWVGLRRRLAQSLRREAAKRAAEVTS